MKADIEMFVRYGAEQYGWAASTVAGRQSHLNRFCTWFRDRLGTDPTPIDVTPDICRAWLVERERGGDRPRTIHAAISAVRSFGRWCVATGRIEVNPGAALKLPALDEAVQKRCTESEKVALMDAATRRLPMPDRAQGTAILSTFLHAGLRRFELTALDVTDVIFSEDSRRSVLIVRAGKGRKRREIPINSVLAAHLQAWLRARRAPLQQRALWIGVQGRRMTRYMVGRVIEDIRVAAGLADADNLSPHGFRHYFATELDRAGVPLAEIQALLGHARLETTLVYLQCHREGLYDAVERLSTVPGPKRPREDDVLDNRRRKAVGGRRRAAFRRG